MKKITRTATTLAVGLGLAGFLALGASLPAHAAGNTSVAISGSVAAGGILAPGNFAAIVMDGQTQTYTADATFGIGDITDSSGTGGGWNLTFGMTQLTDGATTPDTLAVGSVKIKTQPALSVGTTGSSDPATINGTTSAAGTTLDSVAGTQKAIYTALANDGMGSYTSTPLVVILTVPVTVRAGTYTSTATATFTATTL